MYKYAQKANRQYPVNNDVEAKAFQKNGYDIFDEKGKVVLVGYGKTIPYEQHLAELEALKASKGDGAALKEATKQVKALTKEVEEIKAELEAAKAALAEATEFDEE